MKKLFISLGLATLLAVPAAAFARTDLSIGIGLGAAPAYYYEPAPVYYYEPRPAYYYGPPRAYYYGPRVEYREYYGPRYDHRPHHNHGRHDRGRW